MKAAFNKHLERHREKSLNKSPSLKHRASSVKVEDIRELQEQRVVEKFRQKLRDESNLPEHLDDYHTLLRFVSSTYTVASTSPCTILDFKSGGLGLHFLGFSLPQHFFARISHIGAKCSVR
jgi:hypothetical protein